MPYKDEYAKRRDYYIQKQRRYRAANREKCRASSRAYYYRNQEKMKLRAIISHRKIRHGWTEQEYNSAFRQQQGCCAICGTHQNDLKRALHADHSHKTGKKRGLLCHHCNLAIGNAKEDISILKGIIEYLQKYSTDLDDIVSP